MNCSKCNNPIEEGSRFCSYCGTLIGGEENGVIQTIHTDDIEKTMAIPVIRTETAVEVPKTEPAKKVDSKEKKPSNKVNNTKVITFVIAFLVTLVVGLLITLAAVVISYNVKKPKVTEPQPTQVQVQGETKKEEKKKEKLEVGESEGTEEKAGISIDTDFEFDLNAKVASTELSYKTLKNTEFGYKCDIPSAFKFVSDADGEIRYRAEDKTAYMDIGAFSNDANLTPDEVKSMVTRSLGSSAQYEEMTDDGFIMSTVSGSVVYYFKCYVDEFIRYVEFVYPTRYRDVYDVYVDDIEPTFVKTN